MSHICADSCKHLDIAGHAKLEILDDRLTNLHTMKEHFWVEFARLKQLEQQLDANISLYVAAIQRLLERKSA